MTKMQAMFIAKWLPRLRPKLLRLQEARMDNLQSLIRTSDIQNRLQEWESQPLDCDEFLDFLTT